MKGLGPAAVRCMDAYAQFIEVVDALQQIHHAENLVQEVHKSTSTQNTALGVCAHLPVLIAQCETAFTELDDALRLLHNISSSQQAQPPPGSHVSGVTH
mmetsp:Transcript_2667/g.5311  ORF Transcript_2667/g.5311 Transcript_2667/m.5311 type:complete len:99 (+) Transcript_2667:148-444(+)